MDQAATSEDHVALSIAILSDGPDSERLARSICEGLCVRLPGGAATRISVWRFEAMDNRRTARAVDADIRRADVIMVAADGRQPLPGGVEMAMGEWLLGAAAARVGLVEVLRGVGEEEKSNSPVHVFVHELATKARTEFLSRAISPAEEQGVRHASAHLDGTFELVWHDDLLSTAVPTIRWSQLLRTNYIL